jgi:hypothetical protein
MKKRNKIITILLLTTTLLFSLTGCKSEETVVTVNVENKEEFHNTAFGKSVLIEIGDGLYYDSTTKIVYWWNGYLNDFYPDNDTIPSPYYAPNGLPYRYNPETNTFEEIEEE